LLLPPLPDTFMSNAPSTRGVRQAGRPTSVNYGNRRVTGPLQQLSVRVADLVHQLLLVGVPVFEVAVLAHAVELVDQRAGAGGVVGARSRRKVGHVARERVGEVAQRLGILVHALLHLRAGVASGDAL